MEHNKYKLLLIDDERDLAKILKYNLEMTGEFDVSTACSGEEGLRRAKEVEFDIIITDYKMPGIEGLAVLEALKEARPDGPVIFLTASNEEAKEIKLMEKKLDGWFSKPIAHDELYKAIKEILAKPRNIAPPPGIRAG